MPTYTLAEHRALTLRRLRASDTTRFCSTSETDNYDWIDDGIERAEEEFVRLTKCLRTWAIIQLKKNIRVYRLPEDFIDLMAAYFYKSTLTNGYKELAVTTPEKLNDEISDWRNATGTPSRIYVDRKHGKGDVLGVYTLPDTDGSAITFSNANASEVTWICPLYSERTDFGRVIRYGSADTYVLSSSDTELIDAEVSDGNILIEYYRMPHQRTEIPPESNRIISAFAAAELLSDLPEDSAEYKRSQLLFKEFNDGVQTYINRRKRPLAGQELRSKSAAWGWQRDFPYYKELP
jgi:hypothetical protein